MSIASEITRIQGNISAAYTAAQNKGATLPQTQNSANLANTISSISGFENDISFNAVNDTATAYLAATSVYTDSNYSSVTVANNYSSTSTRHDLPLTYTLTVPTGATTFTIFDKESGAWMSQAASGSVTVKNLVPNRYYYYVFTNSSGEMITGGRIKATGSLRMINANTATGHGTFNIRDIGGRSCDGGTLKYGKIFRGCQFDASYDQTPLDAEQKAIIKGFLQIRDDIDLRAVAASSGGVSPFGKDVDYICVPISDYHGGVDLSKTTQTEYYCTLINRIIFNVVNGKPCYVHCAEGADRTGTLIALIEALCGVSRTDIDRGYELTSLAQNRERLRTGSGWSGLLDYIYTLQGESFRDKVLYYALHAGVLLADINAMRHALIDGNPQDIVNPFAVVYTISVTTSTHTSIDNQSTTIDEGDSYTANVSADTDYSANVVVTMGGVDITSTAYNNGVISIASVTGDIVIAVTENYIGNLFDFSAATNNARINSSGNAVAAQQNQLVTDFIPMTSVNKVRLVSDKNNGTNTYTGMVAAYDANKNYLGNAYTSVSAWTWDDSNTKLAGTFNISAIQSFDTSPTAYVRLCVAYNDYDSIVINRLS